jgi:hypothetical protein
MKTQSKENSKSPEHKPIKVRLDYKTLIYLSRESSLKVWLKKYPDAKVVTTS